MQFFEFTVDRQLRITDCGGQLEKDQVRPTDALLNRPYFEVLPRLVHEDKDAVAAVVATGKPLSLPQFHFGCLYDGLQADIHIEPTADGTQTTGARVRIEASPGCPFVANMELCRHLIDIGKNASILAHGVRNPLNAIKGAVVYLKSRYGNEEHLLEFTSIMESEITRLEKFITSFLSTSFDSFERDEIEVDEILRWVEMFTSLQAQTAGVRIHFSCSGKGAVRANRFQIEQALLNVINNAITAMKDGGELLVESRLDQREGQPFVVIEVKDSGPGMDISSPSHLSASLPQSAGVAGKGFGLFITDDVVRRHGGTVEIDSVPQQGTSIRLFLPMASEGV